MKNKLTPVVTIAFLIAQIVSTTTRAQAEEGCSLGGGAGTFGFTTSGVITAGPAAGPTSAVGIITFSQNGTFSGLQTRSFNGSLANETLSGTWNVNPDCSGSAVVNVLQNGVLVRTTNLSIVEVDHQKEKRGIFLSPGTAITVNARKTLPGD